MYSKWKIKINPFYKRRKWTYIRPYKTHHLISLTSISSWSVRKWTYNKVIEQIHLSFVLPPSLSHCRLGFHFPAANALVSLPFPCQHRTGSATVCKGNKSAGSTSGSLLPGDAFITRATAYCVAKRKERYSSPATACGLIKTWRQHYRAEIMNGN
jgi:hypothetical protein